MYEKDTTISKLITNPITISPKTNLIKIREILLEEKTKRVVVVEKKIPTTIITEKDVARKIYNLGSTPAKSVKAKEFKQKRLFTLYKEDSVQNCAKLMKKHRISTVIVLNEDKTLCGIVTKTNLIKIFLNEDSSPIKVAKVMKKKLVTAAPSDPILHVENLLIRFGISRVIIKRDQKPVGIVTFRDFVPAKIPKWIAETADPRELEEYKFKKGLRESHSNYLSYLFPFHATDIMSSPPITVTVDNDIKQTILMMIKYNISGIPVTRNEKLVGIITKSDIVGILAN